MNRRAFGMSVLGLAAAPARHAPGTLWTASIDQCLTNESSSGSANWPKSSARVCSSAFSIREQLKGYDVRLPGGSGR